VESLREHNRQFNTFNFEWTQFFMNNTAQIWRCVQQVGPIVPPPIFTIVLSSSWLGFVDFCRFSRVWLFLLLIFYSENCRLLKKCVFSLKFLASAKAGVCYMCCHVSFYYFNF
jgi:hypothetical protein